MVASFNEFRPGLEPEVVGSPEGRLLQINNQIQINKQINNQNGLGPKALAHV